MVGIVSRADLLHAPARVCPHPSGNLPNGCGLCQHVLSALAGPYSPRTHQASKAVKGHLVSAEPMSGLRFEPPGRTVSPA